MLVLANTVSTMIQLRTHFAELALHRPPRNGRRLVMECVEARVCPAVVSPSLSDLAEGESDLVPDFELVDVNPNSETYNQTVSPRDFLGQISAWYFGHAT